jgi:hypothetical protein
MKCQLVVLDPINSVIPSAYPSVIPSAARDLIHRIRTAADMQRMRFFGLRPHDTAE